MLVFWKKEEKCTFIYFWHSEVLPYKNWGSKVAVLLGSFQTCWQIWHENTIFTYKNTYYSNISCQNTSCAAKVSAAFGILSDSATGRYETFSIPGEV